MYQHNAVKMAFVMASLNALKDSFERSLYVSHRLYTDLVIAHYLSSISGSSREYHAYDLLPCSKKDLSIHTKQ